MDNNELGKAVIEELAKKFPEDTITFLEAEQEDDKLSISFEADVSSLVIPDCEWFCDENDEPEYEKPTEENLINNWLGLYSDVEESVAKKYSRGLEQCKNELDKLSPNSEFSVEMVDCDSYDIDDFEVDNYELVDDGIGWNEFWGDWSYDSSKHWEVTGSLIVDATKVSGYIYVTPKKI